MTTFEIAAQERAGTDLADRTVRALTETLLVVEDAPGLFRVYSEEGDEYTVDDETGTCTCPDAEYRAPDGGCKHYRRVQFHTGARAVPEWVDRDAMDPLLVEQIESIDTETTAVVTDGGELRDVLGYTEHVEPPAQGGERYVRCEVCGRELLSSLGGRETLLHVDGCPNAE